MSFTAAIRSVLTQYVGFTGRARRSEYWWFALFTVLVGLAAAILDGVLGTTLGSGRGSTGVIGIIVNLALLLPTLAVAMRRLHDTDRSGWWLLIGLVPIVGAIVLLVFFVLDSTPGTNRFGANPKERPLPAPSMA
ncbi:DUF805 domain-containing protein [Micromonospora sp. RTP1Z1]|uniref:DUF805 domain-containing protein n=1 Tax=Micromonospora sp. RTP1Z1 TaxID=2994043 RepID=UPI0029C79C08|nr:DUF805 domain-containing protein [Micromonospora sp. RTP1Z1]